MKYYLDTEFSSFNGDLLSLSLCREDGRMLYVIAHDFAAYIKIDPWVEKNVIPILKSVPPGVTIHETPINQFGYTIQLFLSRDDYPVIIADWPDDLKYLCQVMITGPGEMISLRTLKMEMIRIDSYAAGWCVPSGAVRHNAAWDALVLRNYLEKYKQSAATYDPEAHESCRGTGGDGEAGAE